MATVLGVSARQVRRWLTRENHPSFDVPAGLSQAAMRVAQQRREESMAAVQLAQILKEIPS